MYIGPPTLVHYEVESGHCGGQQMTSRDLLRGELPRWSTLGIVYSTESTDRPAIGRRYWADRCIPEARGGSGNR